MNYPKALVIGIAAAAGTATAAYAQQPAKPQPGAEQMNRQMMGQSGSMGMMGMMKMMNDPEMRQQMSKMMQNCNRMMDRMNAMSAQPGTKS